MKTHNAGNPVKLALGGVHLEGFAISALASYVMLPRYGACFDMGHCPVEAVSIDNVFLSHVHKDHVAGLPLYLSLRTMQGMEAAKVYVPQVSREPLLAMLRAFDAMEGPIVYDRTAEIIGVNPGETLKLGKNVVEVFGVHHRIDSVGYTVVEQRSKLKAEYVGKTPEEIRGAKGAGLVVTENHPKPVFTYVGDSTIETLRELPELGLSEVLMVEATYLPDVPREKASKYGHTHLSELVDLWEQGTGALANPHVVIKHFSMRYDKDMIHAAMKALPAGLRERVVPLI